MMVVCDGAGDTFICLYVIISHRRLLERSRLEKLKSSCCLPLYCVSVIITDFNCSDRLLY